MKRTQGYDARYLADLIADRTPQIRESKEYKAQMNRIIDETMSCDRQEAIDWMDYYMAQAIKAGTGKKDMSLRCRFLAAYDLQDELIRVRA